MTNVKKPKKLISDLQSLRDVVEYLRPLCLKRLVVDGIEIEFDTTAQLMSRPDHPVTIDETQARINTVTRGLEDLLKEQDIDKFYSSAP